MLEQMPRLAHVLADAACLLRDAARGSVGLVIQCEADSIDLARAWADCYPSLSRTLARLHGFEPGDLADWLRWAEGVILDGHTSIPAHDQAMHLAVSLSLVSEMYAGWGMHAWQRFLLDREAAQGAWGRAYDRELTAVPHEGAPGRPFVLSPPA